MTSLRAYTVALTCSAAATSLAPISLTFATVDLGGSVSDVGLVLAARTGPQVILLLLGGVVADRSRRQLIVIASCAVQAVTFGAAGALLAAGSAGIGTLVILGCANGIASAFTYPAMAGMLPRLVSLQRLPRAASVTGMFTRGGAVLGMVTGGVVASRSLTGSGLLIAAAAMLGAALAMWPLRSASPVPPAPPGRPAPQTAHAVPPARPVPPASPLSPAAHAVAPQQARPAPAAGSAAGSAAHVLSRMDSAVTSALGVLRQLGDGWREFAGNTWLWLTVCGFGVVNMVLAGAWATIGPVIAEDSVGRTAWGVVMGAFTAGLGLGHVVLLRFRPRYLLGWGIAATGAVVPAVAALWAPRTWVLATLGLLAGAGLGFFSAAWRTTLGQRVPADRLSRVSSIDGLGSFLAMPVGQLLAGRLAAATSPRHVVLGGAGMVALAVAAMLVPRGVRRLPNRSLEEPLRVRETQVAGQTSGAGS